MDQFFTPTRRYQDIVEIDRDVHDGPLEYTEVKLTVPVVEFLEDFQDWKGLWTFVTGGAMQRILWISEDAFLVVKETESVFHFHYDAPGCFMDADLERSSGQKQTLIFACNETASAGEADVFWRAIATSNSIQVTMLDYHEHSRRGLPSGPLLSQLFREMPSLRHLEFNMFLFKEEHCRALTTLPRTDVKVKLKSCKLDPQGSDDTFIEWFQHNRVITELHLCNMDNSFLSALRGNHSVKKLSIGSRYSSDVANEQKIRSLAQALPGNMGIEHLTLRNFDLSIETWSLLVSSLTTHPRIKLLSLRGVRTVDRHNRTLDASSYSAESRTPMIDTILQMLQYNTVIHSIELPDDFGDMELYRNSILPRLEMNRTCFEVQRQAVKRADLSIRPQLLGRALHVVRYNPHLVYRFLSENVPAFVLPKEKEGSEEKEENPDINFPLENDPNAGSVSGQKRKALSSYFLQTETSIL
jgi:hypothetical protein